MDRTKLSTDFLIEGFLYNCLAATIKQTTAIIHTLQYVFINMPASIHALVMNGSGFPKLLNISSNAGNTKTSMTITATIARRTTIA